MAGANGYMQIADTDFHRSGQHLRQDHLGNHDTGGRLQRSCGSLSDASRTLILYGQKIDRSGWGSQRQTKSFELAVLIWPPSAHHHSGLPHEQPRRNALHM
jgi:hypothetical protein